MSAGAPLFPALLVRGGPRHSHTPRCARPHAPTSARARTPCEVGARQRRAAQCGAGSLRPARLRGVQEVNRHRPRSARGQDRRNRLQRCLAMLVRAHRRARGCGWGRRGAGRGAADSRCKRAPISAAEINHGTAPVARMLQHGVTVAGRAWMHDHDMAIAHAQTHSRAGGGADRKLARGRRS